MTSRDNLAGVWSDRTKLERRDIVNRLSLFYHEIDLLVVFLTVVISYHHEIILLVDR